ncbi:hypothetical protein MJD09_14385 [bacterium]|nr:hypothetical protein [bacterium]
MQRSCFCLAVFVASGTILLSRGVSAQLAVKIGIDAFGSHHVESDFPLRVTEPGLRGSVLVDKTTDSNLGLVSALEFLAGGSWAKIGGTLEYQLPRELENINGNFGFLSFYTLTKISLPLPFEPYVTGRLGINILRGDTNYKNTKYAGVHPSQLGTSIKFLQGIGYGFGIGVPISKRYFVEALYRANKSIRRYEGAATGESEDTVRTTLDYTSITFSLGYVL